MVHKYFKWYANIYCWIYWGLEAFFDHCDFFYVVASVFKKNGMKRGIFIRSNYNPVQVPGSNKNTLGIGIIRHVMVFIYSNRFILNLVQHTF